MFGGGSLLAILYLPTFLVLVHSRGRLMDPAARNSMWRKGYPNPVNYDDNALNCGGFEAQYQKNRGKCGVCGDDYREKVPRRHENGGEFGNGIITRRYTMGQVIDIEAELTANHKGWMEVKMCPHNNPKVVITQECLDAHPLEIVDTPGQSGIRFVIPEDTKRVEIFRWKVKLSDGITCSSCVINWKYQSDITQETIINCADVTINTNEGGFPSYPENDINNVDNPSWGVYSLKIDSTTGQQLQQVPNVDNPWALLRSRDSPIPGHPDIPHDLQQPARPGGLVPLVVRSQLCLPINEYRNAAGMEDWCRENCLKYPPNCHPKVCRCVSQCDAIGEFAASHQDADIFCHQNCLKYPSHCPQDKCRCH